MAIRQDDTGLGQPAIDFEALGVKPVSDEELYGIAPTPEVEEPTEKVGIDFEALGVKPVSDEELYGFSMEPMAELPKESFLRPIADPFLNIGAGINDVVKGFTDAFGADNAVSQNLAKNSEWYRSLLSAGAKRDQEEIGRIMQEAEGQGVLAEIGAGLKALSVAPVDLVAQGIGSLIPFIATAGVGKAVGLSKAGIAVLQGVQGGAVGGGIVKGEIYNAVKEQLLASGVDEAQAEKAANEAQAYNGKNLDQILLGVGLGVAASATGAEGAIRGLITRKMGKEVAEQVTEREIQEVLRNGFVRGAVKGLAVEGTTEALQGGQEAYAAGKAVQREGFDVDPMAGVFAQATLEGGIGAILGGPAGGIGAKVEQLDMRERVALRDAAKAAQEAKQNNAPASAAAVEEQINQALEETPEQKKARLEEEAAAAAGIELEEEGGVEPTVPVTPPVAPTPEGAVAPVEPVVTPEVAEPQPAAEVAPTEPVAPTPTEQPLVAERPVVAPETLNPRGKQAVKVLTSIGVDEDTAAYVASRYQDEAGEMGAEEWREFILKNFQDNGGVIPAVTRYSEDQRYYELAFGVGPEEAAQMVENAKYQNQQMAQTELQQNKQWRRKDEQQITEAERGVVAPPIAPEGAVVPAGGVPPSPAIEGRGVPLPAAAPTEVAAKPKPPQLPPNPKFAPLPEPQTYAVLREAREERAKAPKDKARGLEPKKIIGRTAREVLRYASRLNQPAVVGPSDKGFTIYDIAALLAEVNSPLLDKEKVESLGSLGSRGRAARFSGAAAIGVPSTRTTSVETLVHEVAHTLTNDAIFKYSQRTKGKSGKAYIDSLKKSIADKNTPEPVVKLFNLYISTLEQLGIMDAYGKAGGLAGTMHPDMSRKRAIKMQKSGKLRTDLGWSELYGLANVDEFVAQTFSSEKFRNLLKTLQAPTENKSVWESFVNAIRYLLNLPNDTMASAVIEASISIAETVPKIEIQRAISLFQDELDGLNDGLELKLYLENNPSQSIGDAKDDFKKRFNRDPHQFAGQHARFFTKEKIEEEIRGLRDRLLEYQQLTPSPAPEVRESRREPAPLTQQDREYLDAVERGDLDAAQRLVDEAAKRAKTGVASWHGSPFGKQIKEDKSFDPTKLGATTGAGSAKEAFFFAKNIGTSAEYAIFNLAEAPFGDWFWQPKNLNDLLGHMRDLVFGANVSGQKISPDAKLMPDSLWRSYGEAVKEILDAETPEARRRAYVKFRSTSNPAYEDSIESVSEKAYEEAVQSVYEEVSRRLPEEYYSIKNSIEEKRAELKEIVKPSIQKWAAESFKDFPAETGMSEIERFRELLKKNPSDKLLQDVVRRKEEIQSLEDRSYEITEERDARVVKSWDELTYEEREDFLEKHGSEIQDYQSEAESQSQELAIFKDFNEESLPLSVFEWERGKEGQTASIDKYYLRMENPLIKRFEGYRDEKFIEIINKAKEDGYDSVVFENIRDGGGFDTIYAVFSPTQIKSADAVTRDDRGNIIPPSQRFQPTEEDIRYNPLGYDITTVVEDIKAGRTDGPLRAVNNVIKQSKELRDRVQREAARRQEPRARGKAAILDRLSRERAAGRISEKTAQALTDFVNRIREDAIGDTALSIRKGGVSNFNFGETLVSFFLNQDQPATGARVGIHEFFHGLSRFLPDTEVEQMRQDYTKNLAEYLKKNPWFLAFVGRYSLTPEQFEAYKLFNPKEAETKLQPVKDRDGKIVKYQIKYDADNYRYIMLDEWIAEKMTDLVRKKQAVPDTFLGKIAKVIRDFLDLIRARLGKDAYESFYQTITDPKQKLNLYRMSSVAEPFQIYEPTNFNYAEDVLDQIRYMAAGVEQGGGGGIPTFSEGSPEASTLSTMKESMAKVDAASEAKPNPENKPTYKISEIASVWMDQGGDARQLQDMVVEYTNLTPANAKRVANAIAKQYGLQQSIAEAQVETAEGISLEGLPEGVSIPKEADPKRPKTVIQRLIDVTTGVSVPPVKITATERSLLNNQIRMRAAANREAKKAQQETANEVVEIIKAMELRGPVRPKQVQALAKRAAKVIWTSEKSMESFMAYAEKVVANTNYDADLREAKTAQKRALELSKRSTVASPQQEILANIAKIGVNMLDNPREFAEVVNYYMRGFKPVPSPDYLVVPDDEITSYLSQAEDIVEEAKMALDRVVTERLSEKYGVSPDRIQEILDAQDIERALVQYAKREVAEAIINERANEVLAGLKAYDQTGLRADQRKIIDSILKLDPSILSSQEKQQFVRVGNNIIFNNQTHGAELFAVTAKGQQMAKEAASNEDLIAKNTAWVNVLPSLRSRTLQKTWRNWALELQSVADTFRNAFGKGAMAKVYRMMGMYDLDRGFTAAANTVNQIQEEIAAFYNSLEKKYKAAARNQDGILAEGIVGFLIQKVPEKGEVESLAQRRNLIQQDIRNRRMSQDASRMEMADRIERILQQLDGESVNDIMANLKRDYRANYESVTWLKDTLFPKYKEFLKRFDENFNDQANNYENPDYLPIGFIRAGVSLAITPENEAMYYEHVSLRPKQSSYTIKRADYTQLPTDKTTKKPKEIEFNLRRNAFDSLSDQINKAYTSPAWQQIFAFMNTPESEKLFGGAANKEFFIERLNRLRLSRMRRGSMSTGYIEKTADVLSVFARKIGTGIALGGAYQPFKQAPDQIIAAIGTTGRADLMAENMAPSALKAAKVLLDKFSIGRRGDASSGYKYINQMEGAQNKIERYLSESRWDAAKEQAGKIADVWLLALKKTDYVFAAGAWMTYYRAQLAKDGVAFQGWEKEAELLETDTARQDAAAYAEQMTDIYQGSSDPTKMATFVQSGKSGWENLFKAIFVPFNSFAVQQRMRIYSDARDAFTKSGDRAAGGFGLAATIGGLVAFHSVRRFALPAITGLGVSMLYAAFGVDMDEPDEEKKAEDFAKRWRQFLGEFTANLLVGGSGQIVEAATIDSFNYAAYLIAMQTEDETVLNDKGEIMSFSQYTKERSPFWRYRSFDNAMSLGMFDIGLDQGKKAILETKTLMTPEEMENFTTEEQRLLYFAAISDWLYLMRLNDADFARMVERARREIKARSKETEKELARIRAGR